MLFVNGTATTTFVVFWFMFISYLSGCAPLRASVKLCLCQSYLLVVLATTIFNTFVVSFFVYVHSLICLIAAPGRAPSRASVRFCKALLMPMLFVD